jgi:hypothetical protein
MALNDDATRLGNAGPAHACAWAFRDPNRLSVAPLDPGDLQDRQLIPAVTVNRRSVDSLQQLFRGPFAITDSLPQLTSP